MLPLYDNVPRVHFPVVVVALIALNTVVFLYQTSLGVVAGNEFVYLYGAVPLRFFEPGWAAANGFPDGALHTLVSYMFLHAGWIHLIMNMWMLWIFADNIEDVTGHLGFALFYLLCGVSAGYIHLLFNAGSFTPIIGASGGVAGVMGAYFLLYPRGKVSTLVFFFFVYRIPAGIFLGIWFVLQLVQGLDASGGASEIAWWAHIGGFVVGLLSIRFFVRKDRCYYCYNPDDKHYDLKGD